jgi:hypothetical protein
LAGAGAAISVVLVAIVALLFSDNLTVTAYGNTGLAGHPALPTRFDLAGARASVAAGIVAIIALLASFENAVAASSVIFARLTGDTAVVIGRFYLTGA